MEYEVLLQKSLEEGKFEDEEKELLYSLNEERADMLVYIPKAIFSLREARDLLEIKEDEEDEEDIALDRDNYYIAVSKILDAEKILERRVSYLSALFGLDFKEEKEK